MPIYASAADVTTYGEDTITRVPGDTRPTYRFTGRISGDGSTPYPAEAGRFANFDADLASQVRVPVTTDLSSFGGGQSVIAD